MWASAIGRLDLRVTKLKLLTFSEISSRGVAAIFLKIVVVIMGPIR